MADPLDLTEAVLAAAAPEVRALVEKMLHPYGWEKGALQKFCKQAADALLVAYREVERLREGILACALRLDGEADSLDIRRVPLTVPASLWGIVDDLRAIAASREEQPQPAAEREVERLRAQDAATLASRDYWETAARDRWAKVERLREALAFWLPSEGDDGRGACSICGAWPDTEHIDELHARWAAAVSLAASREDQP